jgi:hypothetical protein
MGSSSKSPSRSISGKPSATLLIFAALATGLAVVGRLVVFPAGGFDAAVYGLAIPLLLAGLLSVFEIPERSNVVIPVTFNSINLITWIFLVVTTLAVSKESLAFPNLALAWRDEAIGSSICERSSLRYAHSALDDAFVDEEDSLGRANPDLSDEAGFFSITGLLAVGGFFNPDDGYFKAEDGYFNPEEGCFRPTEGYFKPADGYFKPGEGYFKPEDGNLRPDAGYFSPVFDSSFKPVPELELV